jgi:hypothetical protein
MVLKVEVLAMRVLEVMFFTGLVGCALVVIISWISIFKSGFSDKDEHSSGLQKGNSPERQ